MTSSRISAVIPCYNGAEFIGDAIQSVQSQSRAVSEVIVVDDCSSDDSAAIATSLGATCIRLPVNAGPAAARNRGIGAARGDVVAFLDADDRWRPNHCERLVGLLEQYPECPVAFSRINFIGDPQHAGSPMFLPEHTPTPCFWSLLYENMVKQSAAVVRRASLERCGGYNEGRRFSEDYELWLRLARKAPFVCTNEITADYRVHAGQVSRDRERLLLGGWEVRFQFWKDAVVHGSIEFISRVEGVLLDLWNATLTSAWWTREERLFLAALALHERVPHSDQTFRRWQRRYRFSWSGWLALWRTWEHLPNSAKEFARRRFRMIVPPPKALV